MNYAVIYAAGPIPKTWMLRPKPLWTIGDETIVGRLLRQLKSRNVKPIIAVGTAEEVPSGKRWQEDHVKKMRNLPCEVITSPHHKEYKSSWRTLQFLLRHALKKDDLEKVFAFAGDYVFEDKLLDEILNYPAPCCLFMHRQTSPTTIKGFIGTSAVLLLTKEALPGFLELTPLEDFLSLFCSRHHEELAKLGFYPIGFRNEDFSGGFVEVDSINGWERAIILVARETNQRLSILQKRVKLLSGCGQGGNE